MRKSITKPTLPNYNTTVSSSCQALFNLYILLCNDSESAESLQWFGWQNSNASSYANIIYGRVLERKKQIVLFLPLLALLRRLRGTVRLQLNLSLKENNLINLNQNLYCYNQMENAKNTVSEKCVSIVV